jgi:hypothetical protein
MCATDSYSPVLIAVLQDQEPNQVSTGRPELLVLLRARPGGRTQDDQPDAAVARGEVPFTFSPVRAGSDVQGGVFEPEGQFVGDERVLVVATPARIEVYALRAQLPIAISTQEGRLP